MHEQDSTLFIDFRNRQRLPSGQRADLLCWEVEDLAELTYWMGGLHPDVLSFAGATTRA
mgnify:CR=1 FL=1